MSTLKRAAEGDDDITLKLFDLPQELIIKIVEQPIITLEDRMMIRTTCKVAMAIVTQADFKRSELVIKTARGRVARITGLFETRLSNNELNLVSIPDGRNIAFVNLILKLFRRARFNKIKIAKFNFDPNASMQRMGIYQIQPLAESLICDELTIDGDFHLRMLDVIYKMEIRNHLVLELWGSPTDNQQFSRLPQVPKLTIKSRSLVDPYEMMMQRLVQQRARNPVEPKSPMTVDDSNLLVLITKHRHLSLSHGTNISQESLSEARKIIADSGHCLDVILPRRMIKDLLISLGVYVNGQNLACASSAVKMTTEVNDTKTKYTVEVDRTTLAFTIREGKSLDTNETLKISIKSINFS